MSDNELTFSTIDNKAVILFPSKEGITFHHTAELEPGEADVFGIGVKWSNIKRILRALRYGDRFSISAQTLHIWKTSGKTNIKFNSLDQAFETTCEFSPEESSRMEQALEELRSKHVSSAN